MHQYKSMPDRPIISIPVVFLLAMIVLLAGCRKRETAPGGDSLTRVVLQTDWFPQPEHGGFYQALAKGYYEEAGMAVEILPGGPNAMSTQKVLKGTAHFAMNRADTIYSLTRRGVPVLMVMASLQKDPQALMLHETNPLQSLDELDGQRVMAIPGLSWIKWLEEKYSIRLNIIPHDFGIERFLNDPTFIQQCLSTNEPYYVQQAGGSPKVLPLRDSGFNPYHGIYCLEAFAEENPGLVEAFVKASIRGWRDYVMNDPSPALDSIARRNPKMNVEFMDFSYGAMIRDGLVTGSDPTGALIGTIDPERMEALAREMEKLKLVEDVSGSPMEWYSTRFLPRHGDEPGNGLP
jgi:NitT/TauT family transport system substrate-binding protein